MSKKNHLAGTAQRGPSIFYRARVAGSATEAGHLANLSDKISADKSAEKSGILPKLLSAEHFFRRKFCPPKYKNDNHRIFFGGQLPKFRAGAENNSLIIHMYFNQYIINMHCLKGDRNVFYGRSKKNPRREK